MHAGRLLCTAGLARAQPIARLARRTTMPCVPHVSGWSATACGHQRRWCRPDNVAPAEISAQPELLDQAKEKVQCYLTLGKIKLTGLVSFTASVGFAVCGGPVVSLPHVAVFVGTMLQSMAANTLNQVAEKDFDKLMKRTERRPMVKGWVTPTEARSLAFLELSTGTTMLYLVDPMAAGLGVLCWGLYVHAYTPLKRRHWLNTWVGAVVGAIPPVMGCVAAGAPLLSPSPVFLGLFLFYWQIPHFLSLCFLNRRDYTAAGFQMLPQIDIKRAGNYSLRYSVYTTLSAGLPVYYGICTPFFALEAAVFGAWWTYAAYQFRQSPKTNARRLFLISIAYLPVVCRDPFLHPLPAKLPFVVDTPHYATTHSS